MTKVFWKPCSTTQYKALTATTDIVFLSGNRGGGKTDILCIMALKHIGKWGRDFKVLIVRRTFPELRDIVSKMMKFTKALFPASHYNKSEHIFYFPTGEEIHLGYLRDDRDYYRYHGSNYQLLIADEITNWKDPEPLDKLTSLLRSTNREIHHQVILATNPAGAGHWWVKERYIDPAPDWGIEYEYNGKSAVSYNIRVQDNPYINPEYLDYLRNLKDEKLRKAWWEGSWDLQLDRFFQYDPARHDLSFIPRVRGEVICAVDWGTASPYAVLWLLHTEEDNIIGNKFIPRDSYIVIDEVYGGSEIDWKRGVYHTVREVSERIKARPEADRYIIDSAAFALIDGEHSVGKRLVILVLSLNRR